MSSSWPRSQPLLALAALLLLAGCEANTAPAAKTERPVGVQRITFENQDTARDFVGVVRARYENDLGFRVAGKIVTRVVNVGDRVHAGDVVARLDPQDLKLQVESAEAELAAATSNLDASGCGSRALHHAARARLCVGRGLRAQEGGQRRSRRAARARPALARPGAQSTRLCRSQGGCRRRHNRDAGRARSGRGRRPGRGAACPSRREGSRGRFARDLACRGPQVERGRALVVRSRSQLRCAAARTLAAGRRRDAHLRGALHHRRTRTTPSRSA